MECMSVGLGQMAKLTYCWRSGLELTVIFHVSFYYRHFLMSTLFLMSSSRIFTARTFFVALFISRKSKWDEEECKRSLIFITHRHLFIAIFHQLSRFYIVF